MKRSEIMELMQEAGFSTDWAGYDHVDETLKKYERFAALVEQAALAKPHQFGARKQEHRRDEIGWQN